MNRIFTPRQASLRPAIEACRARPPAAHSLRRASDSQAVREASVTV